ncbi:MAG: Gfo/Idh/MocA family oxidoreductase [Pseudomonadota bacterium]
MSKIGIGIVGGGYMGKRHAAAFASVGAIFETRLRPLLEMVCARSEASAAQYRDAFGFSRSTADWHALVNDPKVDAVVIASPQDTHEDIALEAFAAGKHVLCEKPLSVNVDGSRRMLNAAQTSGCVHMAGFNYIRTPASQMARKMIERGDLGQITHFQAEHTEDFLADPDAPANWRTEDRATGNMGDLAPHIINAALALNGPIASVMAEIETVHKTRGGVTVKNDDQADILCRFESGTLGHLHISRVATGRKMGYAYNITGTKGALRFDQEDQNALWFYDAALPEDTQGFRRILTGPAHPDYEAFCIGPGHGTGYQDQITIQAKDFLLAIETGASIWPSFADGLAVDLVIDAAFKSAQTRSWQNVSPIQSGATS